MLAPHHIARTRTADGPVRSSLATLTKRREAATTKAGHDGVNTRTAASGGVEEPL